MSVYMEPLREYVSGRMADRSSVRVLEAGCGSCSWLNVGDRARVTGIDISEKQLARNTLIDEAILGDLMSHRFTPGSFDLIVCADVLEHLDRPEAALRNMTDALAPGGLLLIRVPNALSWKGLVTKFTPHRFHVWVYRNVFGRPDAGTEDIGPFPTYMRMSMRPDALRDWCRNNGLAVGHDYYFEAPAQSKLRRKLGFLDALVKVVDGASRLASMGRVSIERTEYVIAMAKTVD